MTKDVDVFVIVESWLSENSDIYFSGFVAYRKDRLHSKGGGILILIRKNIAFMGLKTQWVPDFPAEICGISFTNTSPQFDLIACYRPPGSTLSQTQWDMIIQKNLKPNCNQILVGDFNSHNIMWNCRYTDTNGKRFFNTIEANNLYIHNDKTITYTNLYHQTHSNLDLVLSTMNIADIINVTAEDDTHGSDHFPLLIQINSESQNYTKKTFKLKSKRTNWDMFQSDLCDNVQTFLNPEYQKFSPCTKYNKLIELITETLKKCTPRKKKVIISTAHTPTQSPGGILNAIKS
ncbi:uncharacterized protein [Prorops nasuta]|uniref:uncharacterized protein n=1 Tax=Prorops nasuta TaxID=863751 RepID=UPI0034CEA72A